jgi:hypothetical protein
MDFGRRWLAAMFRLERCNFVFDLTPALRVFLA